MREHFRIVPVVRPDGISQNRAAVIAVDDAEGVDRAAGAAQLRVDCRKGLRPVHAVDIDLHERADHRDASGSRRISDRISSAAFSGAVIPILSPIIHLQRHAAVPQDSIPAHLIISGKKRQTGMPFHFAISL